MPRRKAVVPRYLGNQLVKRCSGKLNGDKIPRPVNPARAKRAVWRQGDFGEAEVGVRQKECRKLTEGLGENAFILRDGVPV
jgi:hypothetical protein